MLTTTEYMDQQLTIADTQATTGTPIAGPLHGAKLILATDNFAPSRTATTVTLTQPTTVQFNPPTLTWSAALRESGLVQTQSQDVVVQMADGSSVQIYGYGVVDSTGTHLLMMERFGTPIPLADPLAAFSVTVPFAPAAPESIGAYVNQ